MTARLMVAGAASGVGKTTVMVGLTRVLRARGLRVAVFKCGPDYLDPTYHARAAQGPCHNLDGWMMGEAAVRASFARAVAGADIALIEGVMGVFDGASAVSAEGSSAEVAQWLGAPVLLVLDASGMARTVAAIARGLCDFEPKLHVAGFACNRVGSRGHLELLRAAQQTPPILGGLPLVPELAFAERHLGLHSASKDTLPERVLAAWQELVAAWFDIDAILTLAERAGEEQHAEQGPPPFEPASTAVHIAPDSARCRIGVALDDAFHFYYEDNLARLRQLGAKLIYFSPLNDTHLPDVDGVYLGGGYPELHAERLSDNQHLRRDLVQFARAGGPVYGECGGLMYLCQAIQTQGGELHPMLGLLPGTAVVQSRLQALGYVEVETRRESLFGEAGLRFRGHQFRYSELRGVADDAAQLYRVRRCRSGEISAEGYGNGSVLGSYVHAHWASNPRLAAGFVAACAAHAERNSKLGPRWAG